MSHTCMCCLDTNYSVDFYIPKDKIAIEVDGPSHFLVPTKEVNGFTLLRRKLVR